MASSILLKFPRNTEVQTKDINVDDALSRVRRPLDSTKLTLCVNGVFALPESWKAKIQTVSSSLKAKFLFHSPPAVTKLYLIIL